MKRAFTLLEVIIAAMLIAFMSLGILKLDSNTTHTLGILDKQKEIALLSSSMLSQPDKKHHQKRQDLYTFLKDRYSIDYDPLISALKNEKVGFTQQEVASIKLNLAKRRAEQVGSLDNKLPDLALIIKQNELQKASQSAKTLSFEMNQ